MTNDNIETFALVEPRRGPGGHYYKYGARFLTGENTLVTYGQTELEARKELQIKSKVESL